VFDRKTSDARLDKLHRAEQDMVGGTREHMQYPDAVDEEVGS
jgi:hypothetical protein